MKSSKEQQGEIRKPSSAINTKKQRQTTEWEKLEISSKKLEIPREHFMQRWLDKGQKWHGPIRMGKTRDLFKKIGDTKGTFHAKMAR